MIPIITSDDLSIKTKLNLGSGINGYQAMTDITLDQREWKNIDICATYNPHECYDISQGLHEKNNSIEEIWMGDFFEHILRARTSFLLGECYRVLKPHGRIRISVPDMELAMKKWLESEDSVEQYDVSNLIWGDQDEINSKNIYPSCHLHGYTEKSLKELMTSVGFIDIKRVSVNKMWFELAMEGYK